MIHNNRWRLDLAKGELKYDDFEKRLAELPVITVPTITLQGDADCALRLTRVRTRKNSSASFAPADLRRHGQNLPQEAPQAFTEAVVDVDRS